jgi:hypothetical protein
MSPPTLLTLPPELRTHIYIHLLPAHKTNFPNREIGIVSISHPPPSISLLYIHPLITSELLDHYYTHTTFRILFSKSFNFFRLDHNLENLESSPVLQRIRNVEVAVCYDRLLSMNCFFSDDTKFAVETRQKVARMVEVLNQATDLRKLVLVWVHTKSSHARTWGDKVRLLIPFRGLRQDVQMRIGSVLGMADGVGREDANEREKFAIAMQEMFSERGDNSRLDGSAADMIAPSRTVKRICYRTFDPRGDQIVYE